MAYHTRHFNGGPNDQQTEDAPLLKGKPRERIYRIEWPSYIRWPGGSDTAERSIEKTLKLAKAHIYKLFGVDPCGVHQYTYEGVQ